MITIALTTTSLGVLLPALRDGGCLGTPFGRLLLAARSLGEVALIGAALLSVLVYPTLAGVLLSRAVLSTPPPVQRA